MTKIESLVSLSLTFESLTWTLLTSKMNDHKYLKIGENDKLPSNLSLLHVHCEKKGI
jgi:hypothetical protein